MCNKIGVLCPVSMLPNRFGIGDFGEETKTFIDILKENGINVWQILPMHPSLQANSPYRAISCFAGDEIYISLKKLQQQGLLKSSLVEFHRLDSRVDYQKVRLYKQLYLKEAFLYFQEDPAYMEFIHSNHWVRWFAIYKVFSEKWRTPSWRQWPKEYRDYPKDQTLEIKGLENSINYQMFIQYIFYKQWQEIKHYANEKGISIVGDLPFYVDIDSMEVWKDPQSFLLDDYYAPTHIAGVPPDYFSETGQKWGNPIYDWKYLQKYNFKFWIDRLAFVNTIFDEIRIDHFRALDTYWMIPVLATTAIEGHWQEAPGYQLLEKIFENIPNISLIAEDLGEIREEVLILKNHFDIPGMKVFQFQMEAGFMDLENTILYTGTHDNETIIGWYQGLDLEMKEAVKNILATTNEENIHLKIIKFCHENAEYCIFPIWDIIGLDNRARFNVPGTILEKNWTYRIRDIEIIKKSMQIMKRFID